ncbi:preprotein translocase subunit SecB [Betaproteobacteria bacterium SCGC AG-212-J23]|nr:preprotein translocase subunit SecB [Betaproteobacteria bacterium SCGC AG-212-J23]
MSEAPQPQPAQGATFQIEKVYVKDLSLEIPHAPQVYAEQVQPQIDVQIESSESRFQEDFYEVTLSATVTARAGERTVFLAEAVQGGIFALRNIPETDLGPLLGIACPTVLFPYLRETISDLITRGGFPPLLLAPISFEQLYMQRLQRQQGGSPQQLAS